MLENRGVSVEDIEFYNHIHPVDDLLKFIDDVNANDDPEDTTIGKKFTLKIYTRRWEQASEGLTAQEVQECFDMLGEWISTCEMNTPRGIFGGLI